MREAIEVLANWIGDEATLGCKTCIEAEKRLRSILSAHEEGEKLTIIPETLSDSTFITFKYGKMTLHEEIYEDGNLHYSWYKDNKRIQGGTITLSSPKPPEAQMDEELRDPLAIELARWKHDHSNRWVQDDANKEVDRILAIVQGRGK